MRKYFNQAKSLATSATAKDTYVLFAGNVASAFLGFLFTIIIARNISISDFGVFSAINNLITIIASISDLGISAGLVNFIASFQAKGETKTAERYLKGSLNLKLMAVSLISLFILAFAPTISKRLLATNDVTAAYWSIILSFGVLFWAFFPVVLQAYRRFIASVAIEISIGVSRLIFTLLFIALGSLTIAKVLASFTLGTVVAAILGFILVGTRFLKEKVKKDIYLRILKFSGWVGLNKIISAVSGRLDIQMLAALAGATATGLYSISSRLAFFIVILTSSFSAVLAPRLASFDDPKKERVYIMKAALTTIPIVLGIIFWIIIAEPFITILFGTKYLPAVPVFRALAASMIPFLITAPSVSAIVYAIKKPIYIGTFSFFQLVVIFLINLLLIPKIGAFAPTLAFGVVHTVLAIYTWWIVIRYYSFKK